MESFGNIKLENWRQFSSVDINLDSQTTILTGANSSGKTTILNVLSHHFGWHLNFSSTPSKGRKKHGRIYSDLRRILESEEPQSDSVKVGEITYSNGNKCQLMVPGGHHQNPQYQLQYGNQISVIGLNIPSHRPAVTFQRVDQLPTNPKNNQQQYQEFQQLLLQTYGSANIRNPGLILKQSLISLALFGYGNQAVAENIEYRDLFERFQQILRIMLPDSLGFQEIEVRMPDVILRTKTGDFSLDSMSGGVNALFTIAWQIHMYGADKPSCTVIIDEPENHLHPRMQRTLLPALEEAFPKYKFIVATHSPFIVTSNQRANVYALSYNDAKQVISTHLEQADLASTPDKVLQDILDVPSTIPVWVEDRIRGILEKYNNIPEDKNKIKDVFNELQIAGVSKALAGLSFEYERKN